MYKWKFNNLDKYEIEVCVCEIQIIIKIVIERKSKQWSSSEEERP